MEIWKDIRGFERSYSISNFGRIKSKSRKMVTQYGTPMSKEKILSTKKAGRGYYAVGLCKNGKCKTFYIHRLVAEAFIPNPDNLPQINHRDGNKLNNCIDNLEWSNNSLNQLHKFRVLGCGAKSKEVVCLETGEKYKSVKMAANIINRSLDRMQDALHKGKMCGGFHWAYTGKIYRGYE